MQTDKRVSTYPDKQLTCFASGLKRLDLRSAYLLVIQHLTFDCYKNLNRSTMLSTCGNRRNPQSYVAYSMQAAYALCN